MTRFIVALLGVLIFARAASAVVTAGAYADLVAKAERNEKIDYQALRLAYVGTPQYDPYVMLRPAFAEALRALRYNDTGKLCVLLKAHLADYYVEPALQTVRFECGNRNENLSSIFDQLRVAGELAAAVSRTGDGKTLRTAYRLVTLGEVGPMIAKYDMKPDGVAEVREGVHRYLLLSGTKRFAHPAKWMKIFFNVDAFAASSKPPPAKFMAESALR